MFYLVTQLFSSLLTYYFLTVTCDSNFCYSYILLYFNKNTLMQCFHS